MNRLLHKSSESDRTKTDVDLTLISHFLECVVGEAILQVFCGEFSF